MSKIEIAATLFTEGNSCSQAVFAAFAPDLGVDHMQALRLAAGLGGGMRIGSTCGAATGALLVLGLTYCDEDCSSASRTQLMGAVEAFFGSFAAEMGSTECPNILGCDFRTSEGKAMMDEQRLRESRCLPAVCAAVRILETMPDAGGGQRR